MVAKAKRMIESSGSVVNCGFCCSLDWRGDIGQEHAGRPPEIEIFIGARPQAPGFQNGTEDSPELWFV
jgi:hypothetical protein